MSLLNRHISSQGRSVLNFHGACLHFRLGVLGLGPNPRFKLINSYYILFLYYITSKVIASPTQSPWFIFSFIRI